MTTPQQLLFITIEPNTGADREGLALALRYLLGEDPTLKVRGDAPNEQLVLHGLSAMQLDTLVCRLKCEFNIDFTPGKPQVAYKETVTQSATPPDTGGPIACNRPG